MRHALPTAQAMPCLTHLVTCVVQVSTCGQGQHLASQHCGVVPAVPLAALTPKVAMMMKGAQDQRNPRGEVYRPQTKTRAAKWIMVLRTVQTQGLDARVRGRERQDARGIPQRCCLHMRHASKGTGQRCWRGPASHGNQRVIRGLATLSLWPSIA